MENKLSSVHVNFMRKEEISPYLSSGYQLRETIQYRLFIICSKYYLVLVYFMIFHIFITYLFIYLFIHLFICLFIYHLHYKDFLLNDKQRS